VGELAGGGPMSARRAFIVGGAGFIGSHFADRLLSDPDVEAVTLYDNFSSGREWHFSHHAGDERLSVTKGDVKDADLLASAMAGHDLVIHLASNPDIARAMVDPTIDFEEGTYLTHRVVEAMRVGHVDTIMYASGSGVYGDLGDFAATEDHGPLVPASTYGASKLAGEALISAYCAMFDLRGAVFRFGNVVGPRQTHGVGFDFIRRLLDDPTTLRILGDGKQSKSYIHVDDVVGAVLGVADRLGGAPSGTFETYNVATGDYITVTEIAELALEVLGVDPTTVTLDYMGGSRGWRGDVPVVRLDVSRIEATGWRCGRSTSDALRSSMGAMVPDVLAGRL
jgi:UDP-glucose 4-epimerase